MIDVVMIGGSGLVGARAAVRLAARDDVRLASFVRLPGAASYERALNFEALLHEGGEALGIERADVAVSCLGTTMRVAGSKGAFRRVDFDYVHAFAKAARRYGTRQFILVSSVGATRSTGSYYLSIKAEIEAAIAKLDFDRVDVIRPGLLLGARAEFRAGERLATLVMPLLNPFLRGGAARYRATPAETVARAITDLTAAMAPGRFLYENPQLDVVG